MSTHTIHLVGGSDCETATLVADEEGAGDICRVTLHYRNRTLQADELDFFESLCSIRLQLEPEQLVPLCYGASLNVFPSPMARGFGGAFIAYRLTLGRQALLADLVGIFDTGPDVVPASVAAQEQFYDSWLQSLLA